jgi:hypothetical protein
MPETKTANRSVVIRRLVKNMLTEGMHLLEY